MRAHRRARRDDLRGRDPARGGHDDRHRPPALVPVQRAAQRHLRLRPAVGGARGRRPRPSVALLDQLLGDALGQRQVVLVVLLLSAVLYGPLRQRRSGVGAPAGARRARRPVRRRGRARHDPRGGRRGRRAAAAVAQAVAAAFGVGYVSVEVDRAERRAGRRDVRHRAGRDPDAADHLPGRRSAAWCCRPAGCAAGSAGRDERLLGDLVRQAATAARTSQLADELQDSRERLVVAREEERRRIRRDLHDGLGPALGGVVYQLESARLLVEQRPGGRQGDHCAGPSATCRTSWPTCAGWSTTCARPRSTTWGWSARCASRPSGSRQRPAAGRRARPTTRPAARGGRGGGVPHRRRGADQRRPGTRAPRHVHRAAGRRRRRPARRGRRRRQRHRGRGARPASACVSLRERAAELGGRSEITCPPPAGPWCGPGCPLPRHGSRGAP